MVSLQCIKDVFSYRCMNLSGEFFCFWSIRTSVQAISSLNSCGQFNAIHCNHAALNFTAQSTN